MATNTAIPSEATPPSSSSAAAPPGVTTQPPQSKIPTPPASLPGSEPGQSTSGDTKGVTSPPFSPSSTTPVLEKDDMDFIGNVDVNDDLPTEKDLERVADLLVLDSHGESRPFKSLHSGEGVAPRQLVIFIRHFFCGNCQEYLRTLSSSVTPESLLALPTPTFITIIGCGRPELIDMYVQATSCPFPVYADPTGRLYGLLGMTRTLELGKKPGYIHSNLFVTSVQSIVQGLRIGTKALKGGDLKQVGGEFLIEEGKVVWAHRMRNTRDHAEVEELRKVVGLDDRKPPLRKRWSHSIKGEKDKDKTRGRGSSWGRARSKSRAKDGAREGTPEEKEEEELKLNGRPTI